MARRDVRSDHRQACLGFEAVTDAVAGRWDRPSPCPEWDARGVVEHVIGFHEVLVLRPLGITSDRPRDDVPARYQVTQRAIFEALDRPPPTSEVDLDRLLPALTIEMLVHAWDLGRAVGLDPSLDETLCQVAVRRIEKSRQALHDTGLYAEPIDVIGSSARDRMLGLLGRDPAWQP